MNGNIQYMQNSIKYCYRKYTQRAGWDLTTQEIHSALSSYICLSLSRDTTITPNSLKDKPTCGNKSDNIDICSMDPNTNFIFTKKFNIALFIVLATNIVKQQLVCFFVSMTLVM